MNNCLVTKLKATVNNEALSKLNVLTIKTGSVDSPTTTTQVIAIGASGNGSVSINSSSVGLYKSGISGELWSYPLNIPANTACPLSKGSRVVISFPLSPSFFSKSIWFLNTISGSKVESIQLAFIENTKPPPTFKKCLALIAIILA